MSQKTDHMFYARILAFCVLSNGDDINILIGSFTSFNRFTGANIRIEVQFPRRNKSTTLNNYFLKARLSER